MAGERRRSRKSQPANTGGKIMLVAFAVMFVLSLGVYLNEKVFKLEFIPTSAEIIAAMGGGKTVTTAEGEIAVHYIDVGQGDCELIVAGDTRVLIDTGESIYSDRVINYISRLGFRRLDYVIATHPHSDHIGGLAAVMEEFSIGKVIMPQVPDSILPTSREFERMLDVIDRKNITAEYSKTGTEINLGSGAFLRIIAPVHGDYSNLNNYSIVCRLIHGNRSFLFTGDVERAAESDILNSGEYIRSDVLKVGHHGSTSSSTPAFLEAIMPEYAVIEVGEGNSYGHPKPEVVKRLRNIGASIYTTMENGNIVFVSDGDKLTIHTEKGTQWTEEAA